MLRKRSIQVQQPSWAVKEAEYHELHPLKLSSAGCPAIEQLSWNCVCGWRRILHWIFIGIATKVAAVREAERRLRLSGARIWELKSTTLNMSSAERVRSNVFLCPERHMYCGDLIHRKSGEQLWGTVVSLRIGRQDGRARKCKYIVVLYLILAFLAIFPFFSSFQCSSGKSTHVETARSSRVIYSLR